ncbi:hypothetical protein BDW74DRAFT_169205 [Aspergillus multicolor]|uniref:bifunctional terpene synthase/polyprenyl synthetase family protein n=1 Tax=Aspergillus multicolor TaxID=41759 RepID=UPI003CCDC0CA
MACTVDTFSFKDFKLPDQLSERPAAHFNSLPYRIWQPDTDSSETINQVIADWKNATGKDVSDALGTGTASLPLYSASQCPPHILPQFLRVGYIAMLWADTTDALNTAEHEAIKLDLRAALLSEVKLGKHARCEFEINELYVESLKDALNGTEGLSAYFKDKYDLFDSGVQAQTVPALHTVTWENYKAYRIKSVRGKVLSRLVPAIQGICISKQELDSVAHMIQLGDLITGLTNDFHSFHKEFDKHFAAGTLDMMHNGMAVLMSNYGYDENEASDILKQEVLAAEKKLMADYETWSSSQTPKTEDLRRYMFTSILGIGGFNLWQSISPRYHRTNCTTTANDRAQFVGRGYDGKIKLPDHPPPAMVMEMNGHGEADTSLGVKQEPSNVVNPLYKEIVAPFEKAPAEKIVLAPWEYIQSLPGKQTLGRVIDCLQDWFTLPEESARIIRETSRMLFDATLMLDDIQDGSLLRRGRPAAHAVFGQPQTVNSATYLYVKGSRQLKSLKHADQCREVFHDYLIMVDNKTGGFFRLVLRLLEIESECEHNPELMHLFTLLGRYYQIRDDYLNLASDEYTAKKGFCDDLSEGKFSFPLIHLLQNIASPEHIRGILFRRDKTTELSLEIKQFVLDEMKEVGSLTHTKEVLDGLFAAMLETLDKLEANLGANKKLRIFLLWLKI